MITITKTPSFTEVDLIFLEIIELSNRDKGTHVGKILLSEFETEIRLKAVNFDVGEFVGMLNRLLDKGLIKVDSFCVADNMQPTVWIKRV